MLYGYNPPAPVFPSARRLKTNDPRIVDKYLAILFQEMNKLDLFNRMQKIHEYADHFNNQQIRDENCCVQKSLIIHSICIFSDPPRI